MLYYASSAGSASAGCTLYCCTGVCSTSSGADRCDSPTPCPCCATQALPGRLLLDVISAERNLEKRTGTPPAQVRTKPTRAHEETTGLRGRRPPQGTRTYGTELTCRQAAAIRSASADGHAAARQFRHLLACREVWRPKPRTAAWRLTWSGRSAAVQAAS